MRRLLSILALVIILYLISIIYRLNTTPVLQRFPVEDVLEKHNNNQAKLYLFLFFSKNNCLPCLRVIDILDQSVEGISVLGIIPEKELQLREEICHTFNIRFPLKSVKRWKRFIPNYAPTLYGVS